MSVNWVSPPENFTEHLSFHSLTLCWLNLLLGKDSLGFSEIVSIFYIAFKSL